MFHLPRGAIVLRFAIKSNNYVTLPRWITAPERGSSVFPLRRKMCFA
jgi:hypothetical protein